MQIYTYTYINFFLPQEVKFKHPFDFKKYFLTIERSSMCLLTCCCYPIKRDFMGKTLIWQQAAIL